MQIPGKKLGDFTGLAGDYAKFRQGYSRSVLTAVLALLGKAPGEIDAVDLGAGTGIWTRMMAASKLRSVKGVEPNADMRQQAEMSPSASPIQWIAAAAETTGLRGSSCDLVTAASSFHWMDYERTTDEIKRILRPGGRFVALWNPRLIEASPMLTEIESHIKSLAPEIKRVSSGRSSFTDSLSARLSTTQGFDDLVFLEGRHTAEQAPDAYLGAWKSVNDVQAQLGPARWEAFLDFVERRIAKVRMIETTFLTRAWVVRYSPKP